MNYKYISSSGFSIAVLVLALLSVVSMMILGCEPDSGLIEHRSFTFQLDPMSSSTDSINNGQSVSNTLTGSGPVVMIGDEKFRAEIAVTDIEKSIGLRLSGSASIVITFTTRR